MALGDIGSVLDTLEYSATPGSARNPHIITISGDVYAVVWSDNVNDGHVATFTIDSVGAIGNTLIDEWEFDVTDARYPRIISVGGTSYAIVFNDETNFKLKIVTLTISNAGTITKSIIETFTHNVEGYTPRIINISGEVYAVTYSDVDNSSNGAVFTINIDNAGDIGAAVIQSLNWDTAEGTLEQEMIRVSGTTYVIAYTKNSDFDGGLVTLTISNDGTSISLTGSTYEFEAGSIDVPSIVEVSGVYFAIAYGDADGDGQVVTVQIASDGTITQAITSTLEFDDTDGTLPIIINISGTLFAVAYQGVDNDGFLKTFTISSAGIISSVIGTLEFETTSCQGPLSLIVVRNGIIAVAYNEGAGAGQDGFVKTAKVTMSVYPIDPLLRVSGIRRTFFAGIGGQSVYQTVLTLGGMSTLYISPISPREIESVVTPTPLPSGQDFSQASYERWLMNNDIADIMRIVGHFPSYREWLEWTQKGGVL